MGWARATCAGALVLAALSACGNSADSGAAPAPSSSATPSPSPTASPVAASSTAAVGRLPEGDYRTAPLSADEIRATAHAGGFTDHDAAPVTDLFKRSVVWDLVLDAGTWTEYEIYDGAPPEVGWQGRYEVKDDHTVVATDDLCGDITYGYQVDGAGLHLTVLDDQCPGRDELLHQTVIYQTAPFVLQDSAGATSAAQDVGGFVAPFSLTVPDWVDPAPSDSSAHFVTWQSSDQTRGLRVLAPVQVYEPGKGAAGPLPPDFATYLSSLADAGATVSDVAHPTVDGHPAVELTLTAPAGNSLDGSLGCPEPGLAAAACFGPQDELVLRLAEVEVSGQPVLIWEKDPSGSAVDYAPFDAMLASVRFS